MNLFGVGPAELIVILVVALIFVGPERLPRLAADLARTIRDLRRYTNGLASEFNQVVKELEEETRQDRAEWKDIGEGLAGATRGITDELNAAQSDAQRALTDAPAPVRGAAGAAPAPPPAPPGTSANGASRGATPAEHAR
jgi:sec-independent protein translocase protein TatB